MHVHTVETAEEEEERICRETFPGYWDDWDDQNQTDTVQTTSNSTEKQVSPVRKDDFNPSEVHELCRLHHNIFNLERSSTTIETAEEDFRQNLSLSYNTALHIARALHYDLPAEFDQSGGHFLMMEKLTAMLTQKPSDSVSADINYDFHKDPNIPEVTLVREPLYALLEHINKVQKNFLPIYVLNSFSYFLSSTKIPYWNSWQQ